METPYFSNIISLHEDSINVALSKDNQNAAIIYTLDCSESDINNLNGSSFSYKNGYAHEVGESSGAFLSQNYTSFTYSSPISISVVKDLVQLNNQQSKIEYQTIYMFHQFLLENLLF